MGLPMYEDSSDDEKIKTQIGRPAEGAAAASRSPIRRAPTIHGPFSRSQNTARGSARLSGRLFGRLSPGPSSNIHIMSAYRTGSDSSEASSSANAILRSNRRQARLARSPRAERGTSLHGRSAPTSLWDPVSAEPHLSIPTPPASFNSDPTLAGVRNVTQARFEEPIYDLRAGLPPTGSGHSESPRDRSRSGRGVDSDSEHNAWDTLLTTIEPDRHLPSTDSSFASATASQTTRPSASSMNTSPSAASPNSRPLTPIEQMPMQITDPLYNCLSGQARVGMNQMLVFLDHYRSMLVSSYDLTARQQTLACEAEQSTLRLVFEAIRGANPTNRSTALGTSPSGERSDEAIWPALPTTVSQPPRRHISDYFASRSQRDRVEHANIVTEELLNEVYYELPDLDVSRRVMRRFLQHPEITEEHLRRMGLTYANTT